MTNFDEKVKALVAHAYENAPAIKKQLNDAGLTPDDIQSIADLAKIPVLSKDSLVEIHQQNPPFGGFLTVDPDTLPRIYISPGPIFDPQPPVEDPDIFAEPFKYIGIGNSDRVLNTFAYHLTPAGLLLDDLLRHCGATVIPSGPGNTELQIMMAMALNVTGFVGQPSYLMSILDKIEEQGMGPDSFPIKKALFSAEPYTPTQQARFEGEYGMKTTSAYGTADLGFLGYTKEGVQGFKLFESAYMQIVDPKTGEDVEPGNQGEVVVTLFNNAYPLLRFGTGDLGVLNPAGVDGSQNLLGLFGRSGDAIKVRGMFLHPNQLKQAAMQFPSIGKMQAVITRPDNKDVVTLRIALKDGGEDAKLAATLQELAKNAVRLRIDSVEFVSMDDFGDNQRTIVDNREWD
ncbi:MAG: phenylacetate--CoA ligase family protein [Aggregatilineales bacterium]